MLVHSRSSGAAMGTVGSVGGGAVASAAALVGSADWLVSSELFDFIGSVCAVDGRTESGSFFRVSP